jgi:hypothetical protein
MILPSKHIPQERALLTIVAALLKHLDRPKTVSGIWEDMRRSLSVNYDWFVLSIDLLYTIEAIEIRDGLLFRMASE